MDEEVLEQEVVETPVEEPEVVQEEPEVEAAPEPATMNIRTGGQWDPLENYLLTPLEVGKTYHIKVQGKCEFMIAKDRPEAGMLTNEITFTKQEGVTIWIKTAA